MCRSDHLFRFLTFVDTAVATGAYDDDELLVATIDVLRQAERRNKLYCDFSLVCLMKYHVALRYPIARGGGTVGISGWGCAAGSLEPLTFTRASSAEFCYPILE